MIKKVVKVEDLMNQFMKCYRKIRKGNDVQAVLQVCLRTVRV